jgi:PadR family transcriptional regulator PadR
VQLKPTRQTLAVLRVLLERPSEETYGMELLDRTGLKSGSVYPILARLEALGWLTSRWEAEEAVEGRPRRRYYRLTAEGEPAARRELAVATAELTGEPVSQGLRGQPA